MKDGRFSDHSAIFVLFDVYNAHSLEPQSLIRFLTDWLLIMKFSKFKAIARGISPGIIFPSTVSSHMYIDVACSNSSLVKSHDS